METNNLFKIFGKGEKSIRIETNDCVVYTRVSSAKQMDGLSLDVQLKASKEYIEKHNLIAREFFGGTYESAAKDERKEFQRMIKYLKTTRYKISKILVYSLERFSRNEHSIWLSSQLRKLGTEVVSITQPIDTTNPSGIMQQKMLFIFGEFDNQLRRQKSMAGVKEHLIQGEWVTAVPVGYDVIKHNKERKIVVNETGLVIKKMFYWKAKDRLTNVEIQKRLKSYNFNYSLRRIGEILVNPFYCGKMVHRALEGAVVDGKHEKLVSEEIFLQANNLMTQKKLGLQTKKERPEIALKRFIRCSNCNQPMRGYIANGYEVPYYKCNTKGCKCNRNANIVNSQFENLLDAFNINPDYLPHIKEQLQSTFAVHNESLEENEQSIKRQLTDMQSKLDRLEERFILEELTADLYAKYKSKFEEEMDGFAAQLEGNKIEMSKLEDFIAYAIFFCTNLSKMWGSGDYAQRQELQKALFEEGIVYDRQKDECRSTSDNEFLSETAQIASYLDSLPDLKKKFRLTPARSFRAESRNGVTFNASLSQDNYIRTYFKNRNTYLMLKKILILLLKIILILVCPIAMYFLFAFILSSLTMNKDHKDPQEGIKLFILSNGVHTDIVVPAKTEYKDWTTILPKDSFDVKDDLHTYIGFGWGDKGFYLDTPEWSDLKASTALKATFGLGGTAMHVTYLKEKKKNMKSAKFL